MGNGCMLLIFITISIIAILLSRGMSLRERIAEFSRGAGQKDLLLMVWIFVLAGAFASSAKAMGAVDATVNLALELLPTSFLLPGLFIAACLVSLCMGTSVGTIVALMPIAASLADKAGISLPLMAAAIVGGAFFGDNLSFISDTTIVATQSQGCKQSDKFKYNFMLVLPVAVIVCVIYALLGASGNGVVTGESVLWWKIIPYAAVLITAALGVNVMLVLLMGNMLTGIVGIADSSYSFMGWIDSMTTGIMGMSELILISMMTGGIFGLIKYHGLMDRIVEAIAKKVHTSKGAELSICLLVGVVNVLTANNTVAILSVGDISKRIAKRYDIDPRRSASLLDTTSCAVQGLLPYGAQLLMASSLAGISALSIIPYLYYPMLIGVIVLLTIVFNGRRSA
ncbi:MAG: Na+/H+ antiporter NhaC family protein [Paludibacteraceae bacterium]|nr:Na+/H+ antiporter NhaC family protein [Paludibacteraceae bacterium]MBR2450149.1 Na+/H+ antiporter NhaC family protein [Paludibacteraceae bacterium]